MPRPPRIELERAEVGFEVVGDVFCFLTWCCWLVIVVAFAVEVVLLPDAEEVDDDDEDDAEDAVAKEGEVIMRVDGREEG